MKINIKKLLPITALVLSIISIIIYIIFFAFVILNAKLGEFSFFNFNNGTLWLSLTISFVLIGVIAKLICLSYLMIYSVDFSKISWIIMIIILIIWSDIFFPCIISLIYSFIFLLRKPHNKRETNSKPNNFIENLTFIQTIIIIVTCFILLGLNIGLYFLNLPYNLDLLIQPISMPLSFVIIIITITWFKRKILFKRKDNKFI